MIRTLQMRKRNNTRKQRVKFLTDKHTVPLGPFANGVGELRAPQGPNTYRALLERRAMFC